MRIEIEVTLEFDADDVVLNITEARIDKTQILDALSIGQFSAYEDGTYNYVGLSNDDVDVLTGQIRDVMGKQTARFSDSDKLYEG